MKPLATKRALYLSTIPFDLYLIVNTHLQSTVVFPFGNWTSSQVLFFFNAFISSNTEFFHSGIVRASRIDLRISIQEMLVVKIQEEDKPLYDTKWDMGFMG